MPLASLSPSDVGYQLVPFLSPPPLSFVASPALAVPFSPGEGGEVKGEVDGEMGEGDF